MQASEIRKDRTSSIESPPSSPCSPGYVRSLLKRHEEIRIVSASPLELDRVIACKSGNVQDYFSQLTALFDLHHYPPSLVFNFDETMAENRPRCTRVLVKKSCKRAIFPYSPGLLHITFAACVSADGGHTKTLVILPSKEFPPGVHSIEDCFVWSGADAGWINAKIFDLWIRNVFIPELTNRRQLLALQDSHDDYALLLVDGHSSRHVPDALTMLREMRVDVLCIPSHTSHIIQPLDCGVLRKRRRGLKPLSIAKRRALVLDSADRKFQLEFFKAIVKEAFRARTGYPACAEQV